jgi:hypothetical protein
MHDLYSDVIASLEPELRQAGYFGPVGIDAFVYRAPDGKCRLKPIVEINPRYTMGRLTLELMRRTCPGTHGFLHLVSRTAVRRAGFESLISYASWLNDRFPLQFEGHPLPRIREGALCLNDAACARVCLAIFRVTQSFDEMFEWIRSVERA